MLNVVENNLHKVFIVFIMFSNFIAFNANSGVKPVHTREVIGLNKEYKVDIVNTSDDKYLVQVWLEDLFGNKKNLPVIVTPPVFEMEALGAGFVRLLPISEKLKKNQESVFWLNIQEIPRKKAEEPSNILKMAVRSRIKVFVRPDTLNLEGLEKASLNLKWSIINEGDNQYLSAENTSPYYLSMGELSLYSKTDKYTLPDRFNMVPPLSKQKYKIPKKFSGKVIRVVHGVINDYGGVRETYETTF